MLISDLQNDIKEVGETLKKDLGVSLTSAFVSLFQDCKGITLKYEQGGALRPKEKELYQAVYLYLKDKITEDLEYLYDIVAYGLYMPIEVLGNRYIAGDEEKLKALLNRYSFEAYSGILLRDTWFAVFRAYYEPEVKMLEQELMRSFLLETYQYMVDLTEYQPMWMKTLEKHRAFLSLDPCREFAEDFFLDKKENIDAVLAALQISDKSWFWQEMTKTCVKFSANMPDKEFIAALPKMLSRLDKSPEVADDALSTLLYRYNQCEDKKDHQDLKNLSISMWKNPKLRYSGVSKWLNVNEDVWQMVICWINEEYMKVFFERISARYSDNKERIAAWLKYVEWAKFITNLADYPEKQKELELTRLFVMEEAVASYSDEMQNEKLDMFIERIGKYLSKI